MPKEIENPDGVSRRSVLNKAAVATGALVGLSGPAVAGTGNGNQGAKAGWGLLEAARRIRGPYESFCDVIGKNCYMYVGGFNSLNNSYGYYQLPAGCSENSETKPYVPHPAYIVCKGANGYVGGQNGGLVLYVRKNHKQPYGFYRIQNVHKCLEGESEVQTTIDGGGDFCRLHFVQANENNVPR